MPKIAITWKKSAIGYERSQKRAIESLGLRRLNQTVVHEDTPSVRGTLHKLRHLLETAPADEDGGEDAETETSRE